MVTEVTAKTVLHAGVRGMFDERPVLAPHQVWSGKDRTFLSLGSEYFLLVLSSLA